jgi:hypothetical protein
MRAIFAENLLAAVENIEKVRQSPSQAKKTEIKGTAEPNAKFSTDQS